jgi:hypothetical protein
MSEEPDISIKLSHDEALVLSEFFFRFEDTDVFTLVHNAEFVALSRISGQLDTSLVEMFLPNYSELLQAARERVAGDYEGLAPGVTHVEVRGRHGIWHTDGSLEPYVQ